MSTFRGAGGLGQSITQVTLDEFLAIQQAVLDARDQVLASESNVEFLEDSFSDLYLGPKSTAPTLDNDNEPLIVGALYYDTVLQDTFIWNGTSWADIGDPDAGVPLSDLDGGNATSSFTGGIISQGAGFSDAPADGEQYARRNNEWVVVEGGGGGATLPEGSGFTITFVDADTFQITGVDATTYFTPGTFLQLDGGSGDNQGTVSAVSFTGGNTVVDMSMVVGAVAADVRVANKISNAAQWGVIAADPFSGNPIRAIATGAIGGTQWWVIVGTGGRLATSTDAGVTWTLRTSGTTEDINCVCYDPGAEKFYFGANDGIIGESTDGSTWTGAGTRRAVFDTGDDIEAIQFSELGSYLSVLHLDASISLFEMTSSNDVFASGTTNDSAMNGFRGNLWANEAALGNDNMYSSDSNNDDVFEYDSRIDTAPFTRLNFTSAPRVIIAPYDGSITGGSGIPAAYCVALENSFVYTGQQWGSSALDNVTFIGVTLNAAAYSVLQSRFVIVGSNGTIGWLDLSNYGNVDAWTAVSNGFAPGVTINDVGRNDTDNVFIAVAENGEIARSTTGIS